MPEKSKIDRFNEKVLIKYDIFNSLFQTLPYEGVYNTGVLLPLFLALCEEGYEADKTPTKIVDEFFEKFFENATEKDRQNLIFKFIQYIERQVVLFDAVEDASFTFVNNMNGVGSLRSLKDESEIKNELESLRDQLNKSSIQTVLTAHPTQFYPDSVLGIIVDLAEAIEKNDFSQIKELLAQLAKTPFYKKSKPSPYEEAVRLIWYLENVFYSAVSKVLSYIQKSVLNEKPLENSVIKLGFWPGGDRDGNPFVTPDITRKVGQKLRSTIIKCYYRDIRELRKRLTFREVDTLVLRLENLLYENIFTTANQSDFSLESFIESLYEIKDIVVKHHNSLYLSDIIDLINKVKTFGFHFAYLDIRQDSRVHHSAMLGIVEATHKKKMKIFPENYIQLSEHEQIEILSNVHGEIDPNIVEEDISRSTIESIYVMKEIQKNNGESGSNRYIISNNQKALNVMETFAMLNLCGWDKLTVDVVPLFETIDDLEVAAKVMEEVYSNKNYRDHILMRGNRQTIMLGFSDGTKDGGYLTANWAIYTAKERLTTISKKFGIKVSFFDGRGGPPARGGGKTHQFYASLGRTIESEQVQMTVQGQTISSNFGTVDSCRYNLEQLLSSTIIGNLLSIDHHIDQENRETLQELSDISYQSYKDFKSHPKFLPYLEKMSALKYYGKTNIGSRPTKRGSSKKLEFSDLRAIPFVVSWSQLKQNVPGFYGLGTCLDFFDKQNRFEEVKSLYKNSLFFRTLIENAMMSLTKSFFKLTAYMKDDPNFGDFWMIIFNEYELSKKMILKLTGFKELMENMQAGKASIEIREKIVLPLLTIQQYALGELQKMSQNPSQADKDRIKVYEKIVTRSLFGNTNASRNSA